MEKTKKLKWYHKFLAPGGMDIMFFALVLLLLGVGLVMLFSASYPYAYYKEGKSTYFFERQLYFAIAGLVAMLIVSKVKYEYFKLAAIPLLGVSLLLLVLVLFLPEPVPGFKRWIEIPGVTTFQPSEIGKLALILFCAWGMDLQHNAIISRELSKTEKAKKFNSIFADRLGGMFKITKATFPTWIYGGLTVVMCGLVFLEDHLSGTILMMGIGGLMMYIGGFKGKWFLMVLIPAFAFITLLIVYPEIMEKVSFLKDYMQERIISWLDKDYSPRGSRWQTNNALYAIGSGGFFGLGLGNSKQKFMFVSEPQNDMIFSIVCEELGFVGASLVILLFALLIWRGVVIGLKSKTRFGSYLAMGIVFQVGLQTLLNIGVATDSIPNTGISLPFFSYGGTSLMMLLFQMGMVLAVSRYSRVSKK
ncbi:MAG: FtsW/RodA/SpoVE family cell cycle protein [Oscillospiraceae bacterium]|nr:FtsW/RodA/SpoVE family cell cycle protein [Oscillospiraceae bacterium]